MVDIYQNSWCILISYDQNGWWRWLMITIGVYPLLMINGWLKSGFWSKSMAMKMMIMVDDDHDDDDDDDEWLISTVVVNG